MSRREKPIGKMRGTPGCIRFAEVEALLRHQGFVLFNFQHTRNLIIDLWSFSGKASPAVANRQDMGRPQKSVELVSSPIRESENETALGGRLPRLDHDPSRD